MVKKLFKIICLLGVMMSGLNAIEVGDQAPDLNVLIDSGDTVSLKDYYAQGSVLIYFYPKADTPGCTKQACNLRDHFEALRDKGIAVFGVSLDSVEDLVAFKAKYNLGFNLISDKDGQLGEAFGVSKKMWLFYSRQSYLVVNGKIAWLDLKADPSTQAQDVLAFLSKPETGTD